MKITELTTILLRVRRPSERTRRRRSPGRSRSALIVRAFCVLEALTKTVDAGKNGVTYFQRTTATTTGPCASSILEYENLTEAYATTKNLIDKQYSNTPARDTILTCPMNISIQCHRRRRSSFLSARSRSREKRKPSNSENRWIATIDDAQGNTSGASATIMVVALVVSVAIAVATALSIL
uniref:Uncharacterized protein n=1 Tax=Hyaloperonospora arabidopsidis (strain Emoy2) TaxID=559515 RepID=M4BFP9_HYAAE